MQSHAGQMSPSVSVGVSQQITKRADCTYRQKDCSQYPGNCKIATLQLLTCSCQQCDAAAEETHRGHRAHSPGKRGRPGQKRNRRRSAWLGDAPWLLESWPLRSAEIQRLSCVA